MMNNAVLEWGKRGKRGTRTGRGGGNAPTPGSKLGEAGKGKACLPTSPTHRPDWGHLID